MNIRYKLVVLLILASIGNVAKAQFFGPVPNPVFGRKYVQGDSYRYRLTLREFHNGKLAFTNVSICELKVVADDKCVPFDEIHWLSKKLINKDGETDQTVKALLVKPYLISLDGRGSVNLPKIETPEMTEAIQDFNTFFVAMGPMFPGIDNLKNKGDSLFMNYFPITGDFSNGSTILKGQDAFYIRFKITDIDNNNAVLNTAFLPPGKIVLAYLTPDMTSSVVPGFFNNFQMVIPSGKDSYEVQYGREYFTISNTIRKADGKIIKGEMDNYLNTILRENCDKEYKNWSSEKPYSERRILTLELL